MNRFIEGQSCPHIIKDTMASKVYIEVEFVDEVMARTFMAAPDLKTVDSYRVSIGSRLTPKEILDSIRSKVMTPDVVVENACPASSVEAIKPKSNKSPALDIRAMMDGHKS